jgi:cytochrome P450
LIREPEKYEHWFQLYSAAVVFRLAFGKRLETGDEEELKRIVAVNHHLERVASPGAYLVDAFPSLMKLPTFLAPFKRELEGLHDEEHSLFRGLLENVRMRMKDGTAPKCWERDFLESQENLDLTDDQGAYVVGTMFEAGSGTTSAAMMSFMLAMVLHPQWFRMLQAEVDQLSENRLPLIDDVPQLPTVRAAVKEVLRWRPVTAGGLPHASTKDDVYEGFFIPAGTVVHANQWAIHRDPELYPDPERYNPQRWLDPSFPTYKEPLTEYPNLHNYSNFGFGRRICPGQNIASRNLFLLAARIAWSMDIYKAKDKDGKEITPPSYNYTAGFNSQPEFFSFDVKVRSEKRMAIIEAELKKGAENDPLK